MGYRINSPQHVHNVCICTHVLCKLCIIIYKRNVQWLCRDTVSVHSDLLGVGLVIVHLWLLSYH